jgi:hypothetical protein
MRSVRRRPLGSVKPYTQRGIGRVPCLRCGRPSTQQWSICSLRNRYFGICDACDILLNATVLRFMRIPDRAARLAGYRARMAER